MTERCIKEMAVSVVAEEMHFRFKSYQVKTRWLLPARENPLSPNMGSILDSPGVRSR
jgi:hypothetical protein